VKCKRKTARLRVMRSLLVGGPLSGQYLDMPDDELTARVDVPGGRPSRYVRTRVSDQDHETEVWGWSPMCYRRVKAVYMSLVEP